MPNEIKGIHTHTLNIQKNLDAWNVWEGPAVEKEVNEEDVSHLLSPNSQVSATSGQIHCGISINCHSAPASQTHSRYHNATTQQTIER